MAQVIKILFLTNFWSPFHGGSLTLYSSARTILTLHLLNIWALTWVFVPSDTPSSLLCVEVAKVILFRGIFHINAARVLAMGHLIGKQQPFLELLYRHVPVCLPVVLIFFFGRLWELYLSVSSFSLTSALVSQGQSCSWQGFWAVMISPVFSICEYRPWLVPQAQYERW